MPTTGRAAEEEGTAHGLVVKRPDDGFTCHGADVHRAIQPIVLFGSIVESPTGIPRIEAFMARIRDRDRKPKTDPRGNGRGIERIAGEAGVANKCELPVPCRRQTEFEFYLIRSWIGCGHIPDDIAIRGGRD